MNICHGNKPNTLELVVQQVPKSCHESLIDKATLLHDGVVQVRVDVEGVALPNSSYHLLHGLSHVGKILISSSIRPLLFLFLSTTKTCSNGLLGL